MLPKDWNDMTPAEKWEEIKYQRNLLIQKSNWTQLPDAILSPAEKVAWQTYRDALLNLEFTFATPDLVVYPDPPTVTSTPQTPAIVSARARLKAARITAKAIPSWATWTQAEANTWGQTNIGTPLATARTSLPATLTLATARAAFVVILNILDQMWILQQANAQMTLALRDAQWPDLPTVALK